MYSFKRKIENLKRRNMELIKFHLKRGCNYMSQRTVLDYTKQVLNVFFFFFFFFFFCETNKMFRLYLEYGILCMCERI